MPRARKPKTLCLATGLHPSEVMRIAEQMQPGAVLGVQQRENAVAITYAGLRISREMHPDMKKACGGEAEVMQRALNAAVALEDSAPPIVAVSLNRDGPGFKLRVLELPPHIVEQYTAHAGEPDVLGNGLDQARAILKQVQG